MVVLHLLCCVVVLHLLCCVVVLRLLLLAAFMYTNKRCHSSFFFSFLNRYYEANTQMSTEFPAAGGSAAGGGSISGGGSGGGSGSGGGGGGGDGRGTDVAMGFRGGGGDVNKTVEGGYEDPTMNMTMNTLNRWAFKYDYDMVYDMI